MKYKHRLFFEKVEDKFLSLPEGKKRLDEIKLNFQELSQVSIPFVPNGKEDQLFKIFELSKGYVFRICDFIEAIELLLDKNILIPTISVSRHLIETTAIACLYFNKLKIAYESDDFQAFDKQFMRFYAGMRNQDVKPIHVLDGIRYLEKIDNKYIKYLQKKHQGFDEAIDNIAKIHNRKATIDDVTSNLSVMKHYDFLSEFAHPNAAGTHMVYPSYISDFTDHYELIARLKFSCRSSIWMTQHFFEEMEVLNELVGKYSQ